MNHTPGPWYIPDWSHSQTSVCSGNDGQLILPDSYQVRSREEQIANARLMVAAPELLEVLEEMLNEWGCMDECNNWGQPSWAHLPRCAKVKAAIAKARGW